MKNKNKLEKDIAQDSSINQSLAEKYGLLWLECENGEDEPDVLLHLLKVSYEGCWKEACCRQAEEDFMYPDCDIRTEYCVYREYGDLDIIWHMDLLGRRPDIVSVTYKGLFVGTYSDDEVYGASGERIANYIWRTVEGMKDCQVIWDSTFHPQS